MIDRDKPAIVDLHHKTPHPTLSKPLKLLMQLINEIAANESKGDSMREYEGIAARLTQDSARWMVESQKTAMEFAHRNLQEVLEKDRVLEELARQRFDPTYDYEMYEKEKFRLDNK